MATTQPPFAGAIIDIHCHVVPAPLEPTTARNAHPLRRAMWERVNALLTDPEAAMADIASGDIVARVVNVALPLVAEADGTVSRAAVRGINDGLARLTQASGGRLIGLASVDPFDGEAAADEAERAVTELGLKGLFLDCASGERYLDDPAARPLLQRAAQLDIPLFVHPVDPQPLSAQLAPHGRVAGLLGRGLSNAASLVAMAGAGVFEELPGLRVCVTALALQALLLSRAFPHLGKAPDGWLRRNVWCDTLGLDAAILRATIDCLGDDKVMAGSDWPILNDTPIRGRLSAAFAGAGLGPAQAQAVAAGNARRFFGLDGAATQDRGAA